MVGDMLTIGMGNAAVRVRSVELQSPGPHGRTAEDDMITCFGHDGPEMRSMRATSDGVGRGLPWHHHDWPYLIIGLALLI